MSDTVQVKVDRASSTGTPDDETTKRIAEWSEWRGRISAQVEQLPAQLSVIADGFGERLTALDHNINRRMDNQDKGIDATLHQATLTNGRVNAHDVALAELAAEERGVERAETAHEHQRDRKRYTLKALVGSVVGACTALGGVGAFLAAVHVI